MDAKFANDEKGSIWKEPAVASFNVLFQNSYFFEGCNSPQWAMASSFTRFLDHTQRRTTVGRTPLDE